MIILMKGTLVQAVPFRAVARLPEALKWLRKNGWTRNGSGLYFHPGSVDFVYWEEVPLLKGKPRKKP